MSDQSGMQGGAGDLPPDFDNDEAYGGDVDVSSGQMARLEQAVGALYQRDFNDSVAGLAQEFPIEFQSEEAIRELHNAALQSAAGMGLPETIATDPGFLRQVASERERDRQAEASRPMTEAERFDRFVLKRTGGAKCLPFSGATPQDRSQGDATDDSGVIG